MLKICVPTAAAVNISWTKPGDIFLVENVPYLRFSGAFDFGDGEVAFEGLLNLQTMKAVESCFFEDDPVVNLCDGTLSLTFKPE